MTPGRRELKFQSLSEVMPEVDRLLAGHKTIGKWCLGQICHHLSLAIIGSVDGYDVKAPWVVRKTIGPVIFKRVARNRSFPEQSPTAPSLIPKPDLDPRAEAEALRAAISLFQGNSNDPVDHPFFGKMSRQNWTALHEIHCGHHLSFVIPTES